MIRSPGGHAIANAGSRSEEHTSELQSLTNLVCRLLLEKKTNTRHRRTLGKRSPYRSTAYRSQFAHAEPTTQYSSRDPPQPPRAAMTREPAQSNTRATYT